MYINPYEDNLHMSHMSHVLSVTNSPSIARLAGGEISQIATVAYNKVCNTAPLR